MLFSHLNSILSSLSDLKPPPPTPDPQVPTTKWYLSCEVNPGREPCVECLLGVRAPVHGVDLGEVASQCFPGLHLDAAHHADPRRCLLQGGVLHCLTSGL